MGTIFPSSLLTTSEFTELPSWILPKKDIALMYYKILVVIGTPQTGTPTNLCRIS